MTANQRDKWSCINRVSANQSEIGSHLTVWKHGSHLQVACGQSDDRRFVQLRCDGRGQRQQFGQFIKFSIFFFSSCLRSILGLFLHFGLMQKTDASLVSNRTGHYNHGQSDTLHASSIVFLPIFRMCCSGWYDSPALYCELKHMKRRSDGKSPLNSPRAAALSRRVLQSIISH